MNNYTKFAQNKIIIITKYFFHISNILLIIFYLYPGSIFGCFIYNDCGIQPQLTGDFASDTINSAIDEVLHKVKSPKEALKEAQKRCQSKLEKTMAG